MEVIDLNGKKRTLSSIKKIIHQVPDRDGNPVNTEYVEVTIEGRTRTWSEWWPLPQFQKLNPEIKV